MPLTARNHLSPNHTLFFCVGAQKSGTTWLYDYLRGHPQVAQNKLKELGFFNAIYPPRGAWFAPALETVPFCARHFFGRYQLEKRLRGAKQRSPIAAGTKARSDVNSYLNVLCANMGAETVAVGDVTPLYATLPASAYRHMASMHTRTKFLFLMRDPVDRMWSQIRMDAARLAKRGQDFDEALAETTDLAFSGARYARRADYAGTISALRQAVPEDDLSFFFYEELFTEHSVRRICQILGAGFHPHDERRHVHKTRKASRPKGWNERMLMHLAPQYEFVRTEFGDAVPEAWRKP